MKTFRQYIADERLNESVIRKGAVAAYAAQGKKHGDEAVRHYREAKRLLTINHKSESSESNINSIISAVIQLSDALISTRQQIGCISAQITSLTTL